MTGSECTGKTTLATALAAHYGTICVPEFARQFVLEKGAPPVVADVNAIARGQIDLEDAIAARAMWLVIQDTDLLSTVLYSHHYFGDCPGWIESALGNRVPDLYLLTGIDVPWTADGDQRDRGDRREEMQELFRHGLIDRGLPFIEIGGTPDSRLRLATAAIDPLLSG